MKDERNFPFHLEEKTKMFIFLTIKNGFSTTSMEKVRHSNRRNRNMARKGTTTKQCETNSARAMGTSWILAKTIEVKLDYQQLSHSISSTFTLININIYIYICISIPYFFHKTNKIYFSSISDEDDAVLKLPDEFLEQKWNAS